MTESKDDPYDLQRFVDAQRPVYERVLGELAAGRKSSHWMSVHLPADRRTRLQRHGAALCSSPRVTRRRPTSITCCSARDCANARGLSPASMGAASARIFGSPDDMKFRSSMTLFARAAGDNADFLSALDKYFDGALDPATLARL